MPGVLGLARSQCAVLKGSELVDVPLAGSMAGERQQALVDCEARHLAAACAVLAEKGRRQNPPPHFATSHELRIKALGLRMCMVHADVVV